MSAVRTTTPTQPTLASGLAEPAATPATGTRAAFLDGVRDVTPMVIGVVPFGLAIGSAIGASSMSMAQGIVSGPAILAGAAQLSTVSMLDAGAAPFVIVLSALMINARLLIYGASLAPWFAHEPLRRRLLLAVPVIDQLHFTCVPRFQRGDLDARQRRWYYAGAAIWLAGAWSLTQVAAIAGGARLPDWLGLRVAAPLALAGLLAKAVHDGRSAMVAATAVTVTVLGAGLPFHSAVLVAILVAIAAGSWLPERAPAGSSPSAVEVPR